MRRFRRSATERRGSGGRACLCYRHSTHARRVCVAPVGFEHERERERVVALPARSGRTIRQACDYNEMRRAKGSDEPVTRPSFNVLQLAVVRNAWSAAAAAGGEGERCVQRAGGGKGEGRTFITNVSPEESYRILSQNTDRFHLGMRSVMPEAIYTLSGKRIEGEEMRNVFINRYVTIERAKCRASREFRTDGGTLLLIKGRDC